MQYMLLIYGDESRTVKLNEAERAALEKVSSGDVECVIGAGVHRRSPGRERAVGAARIIVVRRGATITREWPWNKGIVAGTIRLWNPPRQPT